MKKIIAIIVALAMVMALSLSVSAIEGTQDFKILVQEQGSWSRTTSDVVTVNGPGEYTLTISNLSFDGANMTVLYLKDAAGIDADLADEAYEGTSTLSGATILTKSIKINGEEVALTEGYPTGLNDAGIYDICWYNIWATSYFETYNGTVTDIEVVIEVVDADGAAAPADDADETVGDGTEADNNTVDPEPEAPAESSAPAASTAPNTGLALAVVPAVMALAAVAVSKKH